MMIDPVMIVRRSNRSRRGNQPVSVSSDQSQSIADHEVDRAVDEDVEDQQADGDRQDRGKTEQRAHQALSVRLLAVALQVLDGQHSCGVPRVGSAV